MDPADDVQALFQILNSGVIRKIIPSQPLRAKEVGVFFSHKLKPLIITWGRVVFSVNSEVHSVTICRFVHNEWHRRRPSKTEDGDGFV